MTTIFGLCPVGVGVGNGCACAKLVAPTAESAEAATIELPLNRRSRRFNPALLGPVPLFLFGSAGILALLMRRSSLPGNAPAGMACSGADQLDVGRGRSRAAANGRNRKDASRLRAPSRIDLGAGPLVEDQVDGSRRVQPWIDPDQRIDLDQRGAGQALAA